MQLYNTMQNPNEPRLCQNQTPLQLGLNLKVLTLDPQKNPSHKNCSMMLSDLLSPTSSSLMSGDYIGMESSVDVLKDCDDQQVPKLNNNGTEGQDRNYSQRLRGKREQKWAIKNRKFPPPIPLLARTENLHSHMPWVLKRHYTSDGRLILTEEKVRHHEYFRAHRCNGRLTLQLVPLDDEVSIPPFVCDGNNQDGNGNGNGNGNENGNAFDQYDDQDKKIDDGGDEYDDDDGDDDDDCYDDDVLVDDDNVVEDQSVSGIGGSAGKCFNFNSVGTGSPCIFGVPVPAIRHVHS